MFLKNTSSQHVAAQLVNRNDGTPVTSGTTTVYVNINNDGQGAASNNATHEGNGEWSLDLDQEETNGDHIAYTFVNADAINVTVNVYPTVLADIVLTGIKANLTGITGESRKSILNAIRKLLNKWELTDGTTLTVYDENDTDVAYTETVTATGGASPVTGSTPD